MYLNALFAIIMIGFVYRRILMGMTFDRSIHIINFISEAIMVVLFIVAFISDLMQTHINTIFTLVLVASLTGVSIFVL